MDKTQPHPMFKLATELGPLITTEHHERVLGYIASAREQGARILAGGERPPGLERGNFLQATVIADVDETMRVFQEEIFGPVLVAMPFDGEDEGIRLANATQYGLAAYVWTSDLARGHRHGHVLDQLSQRPRPANALRRRQAIRHRPGRGRLCF